MINCKFEKASDKPVTPDTLLDAFHFIRNRSLQLVSPLTTEDMTSQSMPDTSPTKWHLAHTTWFFEEFILSRLCKNFKKSPNIYNFLFNSYYEACGSRNPRPQRGLITRPTVNEILDYRERVDDAIDHYMSSAYFDADGYSLIELGLHHEQQHQELILTDILHLFSQNPMFPAYTDAQKNTDTHTASSLVFLAYSGELSDIGHDDSSFCFDCEKPRHKAYISPFAISNRLITNGEWLEFMEDGGYKTPTLWLSDGWKIAQEERWDSPLYWHKHDDMWHSMTLYGLQPIPTSSPVCHVSYFEADAFARWAGRRLPTEFEWEYALNKTENSQSLTNANFLDAGTLRPLAMKSLSATTDLQQMYGDVWEWTRSAYLPYPGYKPFSGDIAEYNNKFMCGQFVLRGGSCVSPMAHIRSTYRNFFYPHQRWQFSGLRLAEDRK